MTLPSPPSQPGEQIPFAVVLDGYRERVAELEHDLVLANCRIKMRDDELAELRALVGHKE